MFLYLVEVRLQVSTKKFSKLARGHVTMRDRSNGRKEESRGREEEKKKRETYHQSLGTVNIPPPPLNSPMHTFEQTVPSLPPHISPLERIWIATCRLIWPYARQPPCQSVPITRDKGALLYFFAMHSSNYIDTLLPTFCQWLSLVSPGLYHFPLPLRPI